MQGSYEHSTIIGVNDIFIDDEAAAALRTKVDEQQRTIVELKQSLEDAEQSRQSSHGEHMKMMSTLLVMNKNESEREPGGVATVGGAKRGAARSDDDNEDRGGGGSDAADAETYTSPLGGPQIHLAALLKLLILTQ